MTPSNVLLLPGRLLISLAMSSHVPYDGGDPAEQLRPLNSVLGEGYCNITRAFQEYSPEWRANSQSVASCDMLENLYWCAWLLPRHTRGR